jgi:hypothetical protein
VARPHPVEIAVPAKTRAPTLFEEQGLAAIRAGTNVVVRADGPDRLVLGAFSYRMVPAKR